MASNIGPNPPPSQFGSSSLQPQSENAFQSLVQQAVRDWQSNNRSGAENDLQKLQQLLRSNTPFQKSSSFDQTTADTLQDITNKSVASIMADMVNNPNNNIGDRLWTLNGFLNIPPNATQLLLLESLTTAQNDPSALVSQAGPLAEALLRNPTGFNVALAAELFEGVRGLHSDQASAILPQLIIDSYGQAGNAGSS